MKIAIEIKPAEGGADSRLLVLDQSRIYLRHAARHGLNAEMSAGEADSSEG